MASFFEKLIKGQTEEQEEKRVIKKEIKKQIHKPKPQPEPEKIKEEIKPAQVQTKIETKIEEDEIIQKEKFASSANAPERRKEDWPLSEEGQLAIDVYQNEGEIVVQSAIGGIKPTDLEIIIENGMVNIKGSRQKTEAIEKDSYFIQECHWGAFSRQLVLPSEVDSARAEAILKNGVLTIKIPKIQREKVTKLKIKE